MAMEIKPFNDARNFDVQRRLVQLYEGEPFAEVMHQALTGVAGMWIYTAWLDDTVDVFGATPADRSSTPVRNLVGAGILKTSEAVMPIGPEVKPLAWAISDMITHPQYRRQGIGRALLRRMEGDAYRNGGRILYLYTGENNAPAIHLYRNARYQQLETQSQQAVFVRLLGEENGAHRR